MLNQADQKKLSVAVERILSYMAEQKIHQVKVKHRDIYKMANLGNARVGRLAEYVDMYVFKDPATEAIYGKYIVADHEVRDGDYIMVFAKLNKGVNTLVYNHDHDTCDRKDMEAGR